MKKTTLLLSCLLTLIAAGSFAQDSKKKENPKHINFYKVFTDETKEIKVQFDDIISMIEFAKFKIRLTNKTNDFILFKPKESKFIIDGKDFSPTDKDMLIQPLDKDSKVIDVKGIGTNMHVDSYKFSLNGLYSIPTNVPSIPAPNFKLPASINDFTVGNFKVELTGITKKTQVTNAEFKVTYTGDGYGIVDPNKLGVKIESGQEFANAKSQKLILLTNRQSDTFVANFNIQGKIADMQFANMEILWRDTFKESTINKLDGKEYEIVLDPGLTAGKNK